MVFVEPVELLPRPGEARRPLPEPEDREPPRDGGGEEREGKSVEHEVGERELLAPREELERVREGEPDPYAVRPPCVLSEEPEPYPAVREGLELHELAGLDLDVRGHRPYPV